MSQDQRKSTRLTTLFPTKYGGQIGTCQDEQLWKFTLEVLLPAWGITEQKIYDFFARRKPVGSIQYSTKVYQQGEKPVLSARAAEHYAKGSRPQQSNPYAAPAPAPAAPAYAPAPAPAAPPVAVPPSLPPGYTPGSPYQAAPSPAPAPASPPQGWGSPPPPPDDDIPF